MKKNIMAIVVCVALPVNITNAVQKAPLKVNKIIKTCLAENNELDKASCQGFVAGVNETTKLYSNIKLLEPPFCIPREVSVSEMTEVYIDYIKENGTGDHFPATFSAVSAFKEAYPCK
jgi:hypothetical protein